MNSVATDMNFTSETQCEYDSKFLPTLDFELQWNLKGTPRKRYRFCKKPMNSKLGILQTSALAESIKGNTITQECIRRLSNTHVDETTKCKCDILENYFCELRMSGYSTKEIERYATPRIVGFCRRVLRE